MPGTSHEVKGSVVVTKGTAQVWAELSGSPDRSHVGTVLLYVACSRVRLAHRRQEVT